jgi:hypothetical protein
MKLSFIAAAVALGLFAASPVLAEDATATPKPAATGGAMMAKPDAAAKAAKSAECSKQADAKGLHGKERKKFREECKKGAM